MKADGLRARMLRAEPLCGIFVKTPDVQIVEVLATTGLDFICFDAEHSPFDRGRLDGCMAVARALGVPALVRVPVGSPAEILKAMDAGALGVVVPHCTDAAMAAEIARAAHFGHGGRGYAGSTRWAGFGVKSMAEVLAQDEETIVIAQIEEPEGVEASAEIAAVDGIDGLFVGPADLAVCYGSSDPAGPEVRAGIKTVGEATKAAGKSCVTFAPSNAWTADLTALGVNMIFFASDHSYVAAGAKETAAAFRGRTG
ncbi:MAG: aldolase/citrate lyase family protein [Pseudomonadota bacterium]